jgi:hypothetical protein
MAGRTPGPGPSLSGGAGRRELEQAGDDPAVAPVTARRGRGGLTSGGESREPRRVPRPAPGRFPAMGKLVRRTLGGDETVAEWTPDDADSVRAAAEAMRREVDAGYVAVESGEGRNEPVDELPADAAVVILTMPMGGG